MKVLGVMLEKKTEEQTKKVFEEKINFIDNYTDLFDEIRTNKQNAVILDGDELSYEKLIELIERIINFQKKTIILILGDRANLKIVAGSIKAGAYDYILKPCDPQELFQQISQAMKNQRSKTERFSKDSFTEEEALIGHTKQMMGIYKMIGKVSTSNVSLFISGESGNGKQLIAKSIHNTSDNHDMAFVTVNCTMIKGETLEKKFFGTEKEGIDGRANVQQGYLELSNNGTLFLKEIGELDLDFQAKLLEVLQENEFTRIGGTRVLKSNSRIITSSSMNLEELIAEGKFREDLYHKLKVVEMEIPPLRERKDDISLLINYYINMNNEMFGHNIKGVSKPAMEKMMKYDWPGNIRELRNTIKSAMALCRGSNILVEDLPANVIGTKISKRHGDIQDWVLADWVENELEILKLNEQNNYYENVISRVERELIRQVLELANGKKIDAAELLGITRNTLRTKMNNYGLE